MISFEPTLWHCLQDSCSSSVALVNCAIQLSKRSGEYEIVASGRTKVEKEDDCWCYSRATSSLCGSFQCWRNANIGTKFTCVCSGQSKAPLKRTRCCMSQSRTVQLVILLVLVSWFFGRSGYVLWRKTKHTGSNSRVQYHWRYRRNWDQDCRRDTDYWEDLQHHTVWGVRLLH